MNEYEALAETLAAHGIKCRYQSRDQMVISSQDGPVWPNRGNSFWVTRVDEAWYLFTWAPIGYRAPAKVDMESLCRGCMDSGNIAMWKVPADIVEQFGLVELSDDDVDLVFSKMDKPAE
jgi:hypothetical protein